MFKESLKDVSSKFKVCVQGSFKSVSRKFWGNIKGVSRKFQVVLRRFQGYLNEV